MLTFSRFLYRYNFQTPIGSIHIFDTMIYSINNRRFTEVTIVSYYLAKGKTDKSDKLNSIASLFSPRFGR